MTSAGRTLRRTLIEWKIIFEATRSMPRHVAKIKSFCFHFTIKCTKILIIRLPIIITVKMMDFTIFNVLYLWSLSTIGLIHSDWIQTTKITAFKMKHFASWTLCTQRICTLYTYLLFHTVLSHTQFHCADGKSLEGLSLYSVIMPYAKQSFLAKLTSTRTHTRTRTLSSSSSHEIEK